MPRYLNESSAQDSLRQPDDDCCCDADGGHEREDAAVIVVMDAAPVLEFAEHIRQLVMLPINGRVVEDGHFSKGDFEGSCKINPLYTRGLEFIVSGVEKYFICCFLMLQLKIARIS